MPEPLLVRYMQPLLAGRRAECLAVMEQASAGGISPEELLCEVVWPAMTQVNLLFRDDHINIAVEHMAARINRAVAHFLQRQLPRPPRNGRVAIVTCAKGVSEETGAEIIADLLQSDGWEVYLLGAGVPHDELLSLTGQVCPDTLLIYGTRPEDVPDTRRLVELIREIGVCPTMNVVVSGGIYHRADGLWQEVGADWFAPTVRGIRQMLRDLPPRNPHAPRIGLVKKRHRRRKAPARLDHGAAPSAAAAAAAH